MFFIEKQNGSAKSRKEKAFDEFFESLNLDHVVVDYDSMMELKNRIAAKCNELNEDFHSKALVVVFDEYGYAADKKNINYYISVQTGPEGKTWRLTFTSIRRTIRYDQFLPFTDQFEKELLSNESKKEDVDIHDNFNEINK